MFPAAVFAKESKTTKQTSKTVKAAKLTKKNKKARKAYKKLLEQRRYQKSERVNPMYALIDLDNNGIDELIIDTDGVYAAGQVNEVYTYKNGKVKKMAEVPFVPFKVYTDGTFQSYYGKGEYIECIYYRLKNGSIKKSMEMTGYQAPENSIPESLKTKNGEYDDYGVNYWRVKKINNKNVSYAACKKWMEKFDSTHKELKLKYRRNNKKNRSTMLKRR